MATTRKIQHKYNTPETLPKQVSGAFTMDAITLVECWTTARETISSQQEYSDKVKQKGLDLQQKMSQQYPLHWMLWLFNHMGGYFTPEIQKERT